jgi:DinB superfamily
MRNIASIAWILMPALAWLWAPPLLAQQKDRVATFIRDALAARSKQMVAATVDMPAGKYDFKASPEQQTFGQLVLHIADVNYLYCSKIGSVPAPELSALSDADPKEKLVERMKSSFDFCAAALAKLDDSHMADTLNMGETKASRAMTILSLSGTWNDHSMMLNNDLKLGAQLPPRANK